MCLLCAQFSNRTNLTANIDDLFLKKFSLKKISALSLKLLEVVPSLRRIYILWNVFSV